MEASEGSSTADLCNGLTLLLLSIQMEVLLFSRFHGESLYQRSGDDVVLKMILEADQTNQSAFGNKGCIPIVHFVVEGSSLGGVTRTYLHAGNNQSSSKSPNTKERSFNASFIASFRVGYTGPSFEKTLTVHENMDIITKVQQIR